MGRQLQAAPGAQDLALRKKRRELELVWRGARSFGDGADIFMGNFPDGARAAAAAARACPQPELSVRLAGNYNPPPGFNFEWGGWDQDNAIQVRRTMHCQLHWLLTSAGGFPPPTQGLHTQAPGGLRNTCERLPLTTTPQAPAALARR